MKLFLPKSMTKPRTSSFTKSQNRFMKRKEKPSRPGDLSLPQDQTTSLISDLEKVEERNSLWVEDNDFK